MKRTTLVLLLAGLAPAPFAQAAEFNAIRADKSALTFTFTQMGVPVDGSFKKFAARIAFDPLQPGTAKAAIDLDLAGIDAGSPEANDEVAGKTWFDSKSFPRAEFVSTAVKALGGNRYEVAGTLTIKGRTRNVSAPFTLTPQGNGAAFDGAFVLKRADFAIGEGEWADFGTVANDIRIKFHFLATARK